MFIGSVGIIPSYAESASVSGKQFTPVYYMFPMILISMRYRDSKLVFLSLILCYYMLLFVAFRQVFILTAAASVAYLFVLTRRVTGRALSLIFYFLLSLVFSLVLMFGFASKKGVTNILYGIADLMESAGIPYHYQYQLVLKTAATLNGVYRSEGDRIYYYYATNIFNFEKFWWPRGIGQKYSIGDPDIWAGNTLDNSFIFFNYHFSIFVMLILLVTYVSFFFYNLFRQELVNVPVYLACFSAFSLFIYFRAYVFLDISIATSFAFFLTAVAISGRSRTSGGPVRGSLR
ncbi:hypothetical protein [Martelella sp. AD-3]|uniref:hypothetical protein n=1 Tax=Martelella sp. AD-3 TaxID=686597 RepID=UPI000ACFCCDD|nr:hypothetical protein [Martelella sp. AD-3]